MWKLVAKFTALVFFLCILAGVGLSAARGRAVEWPPILVISALCAAIGSIRFVLILRKERNRLIRLQHAYVGAMQELVDAMARLSPADLSIFAGMVQLGEPKSECMTVQGSSNHLVFVQMADLGLMKPLQMERIGDRGYSFVSTRYGLTPRGYEALPILLETVAKRRRWFATQGT